MDLETINVIKRSICITKLLDSIANVVLVLDPGEYRSGAFQC